MARINIEDSIFKDIRFIDLIGMTGGIDTALGMLVRAWSLAQSWYLNEESKRLIPIEEWDRQRLSGALFEVGLAELRDGFVYVSGSDEQFQWLIQKKAGGETRAKAAIRNKDGSFRKKTKKTVRHKPTKLDSDPAKLDNQPAQASTRQALPLPLPLSPSLPQSSISSSALGDTTGVAALAAVDPTPTTLTWRAYKDAYRAKYGQDPTPNKKVMGQVAQFVRRVPAEEAPDIVRFYVSSPKTFYVQNLHDFGLCLSDAEKLRTQWLNGKHVTDSMVQEYRKAASEPRQKGIAEILAEKSSVKAGPRLVNGGEE